LIYLSQTCVRASICCFHIGQSRDRVGSVVVTDKVGFEPRMSVCVGKHCENGSPDAERRDPQARGLPITSLNEGDVAVELE
jgi:hypothetical protein